MLLTELLTADRIKVPLGSRTKDDVLRELVRLATAGRSGADQEAVLEAVRERERSLSTGIGRGVAIPHGKSPYLDQLVVAAGITEVAIDYEALDDKPVRLFFLLVGPESASGAHVKALGRISRLLSRDQLRSDLLDVESAADFLGVVKASEAS